MLGVWVLYVGACKSAQGIWDNMLFAQLMSNIKFELLQKLRGPYKPQIELYCQGCGCDQELLRDVDYWQVIRLDDHV